MIRWATLFIAALVAASAAAEARGQWGYGYYPRGYRGYGWGGWGGGNTVQGSIARGLGAYAMGAGAYNLQTAQARSINTNTALRWNQYWWEAQMEANRRERIRLDQRAKRDAGASAALEKRVRDNPLAEDITSGDALNAALDQVTDPRVQSSALRLGTTRVPGKVIRDIPFFVATDAASITLDVLTAEKGWPFALRDPVFEHEKRAFSEAVDRTLAEDTRGNLAPSSVRSLRDALDRLNSKYEANRPANLDARAEADTYMKELYGMVRLLERPDIDKVLAELDTIRETTLGSLLGFMHTFNLRFAPAESPSQRDAYAALYPHLDKLRDRVVASGGPNGTPLPPSPAPPGEFFAGLDMEHLQGPHRVIDRPKK